jgi:hypothetical protein
MVDLVSVVVQVIVAAIVLAPVLWIVGRWLAGKDKAKFTDALWIAVLGVIIGAIVGALLPGWGWISWIIMIVVWLYLIHHFFDCSWLKALLIAIVVIIVYVIIVAVILGVILALLGLGAIGALF